MRANLGAGLLLVATTLVAVAATPAGAASVCDDGSADTTWVGPATADGSASWAESSNWSNGVPTGESAVCIPLTVVDPHVLEGTHAEAGVVTLAGPLTVESTLDVTALRGEDFGQLLGPGTTTVTQSMTGDWLILEDHAVVEVPQDVTASLSGRIGVFEGARLNVRGNAVLADGATIDAYDLPRTSLFTIADTGSLTLEGSDSSASVEGGFANHGQVTVTAGQQLTMFGAWREVASPDQFSTGTFTAVPGADLWIVEIELRTGARIDHARFIDHITVPAGNTATVAGSTLVGGGPDSPVPSASGAGELVVTDGTTADARIGGTLTVTVPSGEVFNLGGPIQENARVDVQAGGELREPAMSQVTVLDEAVIDVSGTYRTTQTGGTSGTGPAPGDELGTLRIRPGATLLKEGPGGGQPMAEVVNEGTVRVDGGMLGLQLAGASDPSTGSFDVAQESRLFFTGVLEDHPTVALGDGASVRGPVIATAHVVATGVTFDGADVSTDHTFVNGTSSGSLHLAGTTTLKDGTRLHGAGPIVIDGELEADAGPGGVARVAGAKVIGGVHAVSGTLSVPRLDATTLLDNGTLAGGRWVAAPGATLDLPRVRTNEAELVLEGPSASFGEGFASLAGIGAGGRLSLLAGADLTVARSFVNEGILQVSPGSFLDVGGVYRQAATGALRVGVVSDAIGRVRAGGLRDLAGNLWVQRDPAYAPGIGTVRSFLTSDGARGTADAFDKVVSPVYGTRRLRVDYDVNRVRLWVDRVG